MEFSLKSYIVAYALIFFCHDVSIGTDRQIPILEQPQSAGILSIAIPLLIAGIIVLFIAVLVGVRCKRKRDRADYGEDYEFSLVDQSIVRIILVIESFSL